MKGGYITCGCGKKFYIETVRSITNCIECGQKHDVSDFPEIKVRDIEPAVEELGDDVWN